MAKVLNLAGLLVLVAALAVAVKSANTSKVIGALGNSFEGSLSVAEGNPVKS